MLIMGKASFVVVAASVASLLIGAMAPLAQAASPARWGDFGASAGDKITASSWGAGGEYFLHSSDISVGDIQAMRDALKRNDTEMQNLKSKLDSQTRALEDLKKNTGSSSGSSDGQLSELKRTVSDQKSTIDKLKSEIDDLKRNSSSSSSSSSSELSSLKSTVSDQKRSLEDLKRSVDTLSSKVK
ncbi:hypothetical protein [Pseudomonas sp. K2I15]|uniref:hypothetical protein n=1 Tax=unclassified Pseudomonas TaxID=196821 RepID=UPI000B4C6588|nr:hypothetical protein [Pseudomonas sp. K2I15]OWP73275.1 hypothetical protein CEC48_02250 [Pseudomonas sp. K2I15]